MKHEIELRLPPEVAGEASSLQTAAAKHLGIEAEEITAVVPIKRSLDARSKKIVVQLKVAVYCGETPAKRTFDKDYPNVASEEAALIVGAGPAGLFAALRLIELGVKPIILERGKDVRSRRRDLASIHKHHEINPDSNYCFGEGGAGTYSDGKLYTRSTKRGNVERILNTLVSHGATPDILVEAHPHIGTNKLPQIVEALRASILDAGGEVHFNSRVEDFLIEQGQIKGVALQNGDKVMAQAVILATGHSARNIFELLHRKNILIEAKPFAMGVRIEHPQALIDTIRYRKKERGPWLPPASYNLTQQVEKRGVYSFCMCPGGIIAPCATAPEEIVTNGWSPSKRNNPFANSGMVVAINLEDLTDHQQHGPLAGLALQKEVERTAWIAGGKSQTAPAQRMMDYLENKHSASLPDCSYQPGLQSADLSKVLPGEIHNRLKQGLKVFAQQLKGYGTNEAVLVATESRTSSPVRIPRDRETLEHPEVSGFYPCGEGAGYAGGIVSAAIDGERCAVQLALKLGKKIPQE